MPLWRGRQGHGVGYLMHSLKNNEGEQMALIKCKECGNEVSTKAAACPKCGAKVARTRPLFKVLGFMLLGLFVVGAFMPRSHNAATAPTTPPTPDPREIQFKQARLAALAIKQAVRDPDSLKFDSINTNEDGSVVCIEYRAKNGFGGVNREYLVYDNGAPREGSKAWNKLCAGKRMYSHDSAGSLL